MGVCFLCWQHSTWIVFDQWAWNNSSFFWQPMNSHVAKVTTWTNVVNLNSGFFDVSVHQYIPSPGRGDEFAGQCREQMVYSLFDPPPCPEMNPSCLELGVRKNMFPVYVAFETPSYTSPLCRKPLRRLDFRFQFASRGGESTLHLFKERKVDCFFPSQLSLVVSNISTTCSLDCGNSCALRPLYFARSVCVWTGFRFI